VYNRLACKAPKIEATSTYQGKTLPKGETQNINYLVHKLTLWLKCRWIVKPGADGRPDRILKRRPKPIFDVDSTDIEMKIKLSMTATSPGKEGESGGG
jgi:hypothetical protein